MKREKKQEIIEQLSQQLQSYKHFYVTDIAGLDAEKTQQLRKECFNANIKLILVKNTLLRVALTQLSEGTYDEMFSSLTGSSALMLCDTANAPAKVIKNFAKDNEKPVLKAAFAEESIYMGESQLENLVAIKSKEQLIGDVLLALQSPIQNLISSLESGKNNITGVLKALEDK